MSNDQSARDDELDKELGLTNEMGGAGIREFVRQLGINFGGPAGMAKKMRLMWEDADTPAATKHAIMTLVTKAYAQEAEENAKANFESMSRDELVAYIKRLIKNHGDKLPEVFGNGD